MVTYYDPATCCTIYPAWVVSNATTTTGATYVHWHNALTSTATYSVANVYRAWTDVNADIAVANQLAAQQQRAPFGWVKKTEAEVKAALEEKVKRAKAAADARARAEKLLLESLNPEQRSDMLERGRFYLLTQSGRRYRIDRHTHGNVKLVDEKGGLIEQYCAQPNGIPADDAILAQKLMLETDEKAFLKVANMTRLR